MGWIGDIITAVVSLLPKALALGCELIGYTKEGVEGTINTLGGSISSIGGMIWF